MQIELEAEKEVLLQKGGEDKDEMVAQYEEELEGLREEMANLQRDRDESLLIAENDRQQVCQGIKMVNFNWNLIESSIVFIQS